MTNDRRLAILSATSPIGRDSPLLAVPRVAAFRCGPSLEGAIEAAIRSRLGDVRIDIVRRTRAQMGPGASAPRVLGSFAAWPGVHRLRVITTDEGALDLDFPLAGISDAEPCTLRARPGIAVLFDLDRDLIGQRTEEGWTGEYIDVLAHHGLRRQPIVDAPRSRLADAFVRRIGFGNAAYVAIAALLSAVGTSFVPFVLSTSFVHYAMYLATMQRRRVAFAEMLRDVVFFKTISMATLAALHLTWWSFEPISIATMLLGIGLSSWAARTLGLERTYFGVELGITSPRMISAPPYRWIPHPMIAGATLALIGAHLQPVFAQAWPWLVPAHLLGYAAVLIQELRTSPISETAGRPDTARTPETPTEA